MTTNGNLRSISDVLNEAVCTLQEADISTARLDGELLLSHVLKCNRIDLVLNRLKTVTEQERTLFFALVSRRCTHEPVSYILGEKEFMSLPFCVQKGILIPRPETEQLVEMVIEKYQSCENPSILDLCTGSGAIAISLAYYLKTALLTAVDKYDICLNIAMQNAQKHNVLDRLTLIHADVLRNFSLPGVFDCIVSNPPYVTKKAMDLLVADVKEFEPAYALDGGDDGLIFYRAITKYAVGALKKGGGLYFEIGYDQGEAVYNILENTNRFFDIQILKDYAGHDRYITAFKGDI